MNDQCKKYLEAIQVLPTEDYESVRMRPGEWFTENTGQRIGESEPFCMKIALAFLIMVSAWHPAWSVAAQNEIRVFQVDAEGKTGREIGAELGRAIKSAFPDIERIYDRYLAGFIRQDQFNQWVRSGMDVIKVNIDPAYRDELSAMASTWQISGKDRLGDGFLSLNELWFFQLMPDVGRRTNCSGFGVLGNVSATHAPLVGRNVDWDTTEDLRSLQAITVYDYGKDVLVNIGFAGYIGVISGFNNHGLYLAHLDSPLGIRYSQPAAGAHSIVFDLRKALENEATVGPAAEFLMAQQFPFSHNVLMADRDEIRVLEQPDGKASHLRTPSTPTRPEMPWGKKDQIAVVNCFVSEESPSNCIESKDIYRWQRFGELAVFEPGGRTAQIDDLTRIMFDTANRHQAIFNAKTFQSMVFSPKDGRLFLYAAPISNNKNEKPVMTDVSHLLPKADMENDSYRSEILLLWSVVGVLAGVVLWVVLKGRKSMADYLK